MLVVAAQPSSLLILNKNVLESWSLIGSNAGTMVDVYWTDDRFSCWTTNDKLCTCHMLTLASQKEKKERSFTPRMYHGRLSFLRIKLTKVLKVVFVTSFWNTLYLTFKFNRYCQRWRQRHSVHPDWTLTPGCLTKFLNRPPAVCILCSDL